MKRFLMGTVVAIAFAGAPLKLNNLIDLLNEAYPIDSAKRQALSLCALSDPSFNRLDRTARESCYRRHGTAPAMATARARMGLAPNSVALQKALAWKGAPAKACGGWGHGRGQENPRIHYLPDRRSNAGH
jgi:hypothetical protein